VIRRLRLALVLVSSLIGCDSGRPPIDAGGPVAGWPEYGGSKAGIRYSPLTQITKENVDRLEVAWTHRSGDFEGPGVTAYLGSSFQATPILVDDALVYCTPFNRVFSIDAATGAERWSYDAKVERTGLYLVNCRGVSHWRDPEAQPGAVCAERIFMGTLDARIVALDAKTGRPCEDFGAAGAVSLREGIGDVRPGEYGVTSAPLVLEGRVITGSMVLDNRRTDMPGGVVRAYDARSGALAWAWDPVPPGEAVDTGSFRRGTTNAWSTLSGDAELGLIYVPTGNTSADYYGGHRDGLDYYSSSVVALHVATGEVAWHFQTVHHDVWDYDVPSQPALFEFPGAEGPIPALAQATKMGHLFLLDRRTGEPLFPVEERPVPQSPVPGELLSPTQPFPTHPPPLHPARLDPEDAFGFTPWDRGKCREHIENARSEGIFTPPSLEGSIHYPGFAGGMNWGSVAIDPVRGWLVTNQQRTPGYVRLVPRADFEAQFPDGEPAFGYEPQAGTPYAVQRLPLLSPLGVPCNPPPWGTLTAVDLVSGEVRWERELGTTRDLAPFPIWLSTGVPNLGGPITTASGVVFIASTTDYFLRAFDLDSGDELWKGRLPTSAQSTPMTYRLRDDGPQYVVIAAGGHGMLPSEPGDHLIAFTLH
jgi:quinoprotein glucose dehydrogenase